MPAHSYRVNNCGTVDLLLDRFVFNTPPGIKHVANLANFGGRANFSGNTFSVTSVTVPPNESLNFTVDYEYVSGPACCRFGNIIISTVTGKINTIFTTINVSDLCTVETVIASCSVTPAQTVLTFNVPPAPCTISPNQVNLTLGSANAVCSLTPNQATWSVGVTPVPAPVPAPASIICSLSPVQMSWSVDIPSGSWAITNGSASSQLGGSTFIFNWTAPSTAVGSKFSWFVVKPGTTTPFNDTGISGSFLGAINNLSVLASQSGAINVQTNIIGSTNQSFQVVIVSAGLSSTVLARSPTCTITLPLVATYRFISPATNTSVNEGELVNFQVSTTNVAAGTVVWWAANPIGGFTVADAAYGVSGSTGTNTLPLEGTFTVSSTTAILLPIRIATDRISPESGDGFTLRLYASQADKNNNRSVLAESPTITINDNAPPSPTYAFVSPFSNTTVSEGNSVTFTVATTNVATGTQLWWAAIGIGGATPPDASSPQPPQGSIYISNNNATINVGVATDTISPELGEGFKLRLYTSEAARNSYGTGVAESVQVLIVDVPMAPSLIIGSAGGSHDSGSKEYTAITNLPVGTTLYWQMLTTGGDGGSGAIAQGYQRVPLSDFVATSGTFQITQTNPVLGTLGSFEVTLKSPLSSPYMQWYQFRVGTEPGATGTTHEEGSWVQFGRPKGP